MFYPMFSNLRTLYKLFFFLLESSPIWIAIGRKMKERRNGGTEGGREGRKERENTRTNDSTALDKGYTVLIIKHIFTMSE